MRDESVAVLGVLAIIAGMVSGYFIYVGYGIETSVDVDGQTVANLQLMHFQMLNMAIGLASAVVSAVFLTGALLAGGRN